MTRVSDTTTRALQAQAAAYYESKLMAHGATPQGVDWNSEASQHLRFEQLLRIVEPHEPAGTIIDYGCGYGALAGVLAQRFPEWAYSGFDASTQMIAAARKLFAGHPRCSFADREEALGRAAYTMASGIFNVKLDTDAAVWETYVLATLDRFAALSERGFAFNVLTIHSDPDRRRSDLYYADPTQLFEHCRRTFSRHVALLHDYKLFEFTILVRL